MFDHPQVIAENLVARVQHSKVGRYRGMTRPVKLSESPSPPPFAAPAFGQHTEKVLAEYGFSQNEITELRTAGAIHSETQPALKR
jgi:crotonobetainyl-CoA:carnitine CoA-transferase CaiB-like acyl-CoA transferase